MTVALEYNMAFLRMLKTTAVALVVTNSVILNSYTSLNSLKSMGLESETLLRMAL